MFWNNTKKQRSAGHWPVRNLKMVMCWFLFLPYHYLIVRCCIKCVSPCISSVRSAPASLCSFYSLLFPSWRAFYSSCQFNPEALTMLFQQREWTGWHKKVLFHEVITSTVPSYIKAGSLPFVHHVVHFLCISSPNWSHVSQCLSPFSFLQAYWHCNPCSPHSDLAYKEIKKTENHYCIILMIPRIL